MLTSWSLVSMLVLTAPQPQSGAASQQAQEPLPLVRLELADGQALRGVLEHETEEALHVRLANGALLTVARAGVLRLELDERAKVVHGEVRPGDPHRTRYLYSPSAFMLKQGEGYVSQKELFFTTVAVGVTDHVTIQAGSVLPAWFSTDGSGANFIGGLKVGGEVAESVAVAAGAQTFVVPGSAWGALGFVYGSLTLGSSDAHLTVSGGKAFSMSDGGSSLSPPLFTLSGAVRTSTHSALVTENWFLPSSGGPELISAFAVRAMNERLAGDVGLVFLGGVEVPIPWLGLALHWA